MKTETFFKTLNEFNRKKRVYEPLYYGQKIIRVRGLRVRRCPDETDEEYAKKEIEHATVFKLPDIVKTDGESIWFHNPENTTEELCIDICRILTFEMGFVRTQEIPSTIIIKD